MTNKHIILLLACLPFVTGCNKLIKHIAKGGIGGADQRTQEQIYMTPHSIAFLGWGQSNMLGLTEGGQPWNQWPPMEQLHIYDEYMIGYGQPYQGYRRGPLYYMALLYLQKFPAATVYILNCSDSGSTADDWTPGSKMFVRCQDWVATMLPPGVPIQAQFAIQGETEGIREAHEVQETQWAQKFTATTRAFESLYNIPVLVYGQIGIGPAVNLYWQDIKNQQVTAQAPNMLMVKTDDLQTVGDGVHYDIYATRALGARFFRAYYGFISGD